MPWDIRMQMDRQRQYREISDPYEFNLVKDLGYWASNDGSSEQHIDKIVQSACNISGWVLRTFQTREILPMKTLLQSLIIPILDYCSPLYNPPSISLKMKLEKSFCP